MLDRLRKISKWALIVLIALLIGFSVYLYNPLPSNPSAAELAEAASRYAVDIARDEWGVPHIRGDSDADVSFGLAYAHAEDDFATIQEVIAATRGVLARYRGEQAAVTDYIVHFLDVWGIVERRYDNDVPEDVKAIADAYAAGLNLFASRHPQQTWRGLAPFSAQDVVAGFVFKTPFFYGLDKELKALFDEERMPNLEQGQNETQTAAREHFWHFSLLGSNAIAVNRKRSGDGTTRLLINSHQPMTGPVAWYEAHLYSDESVRMSGGLFPGTPFILHGFNENLGWANTVNHIDLSDVYVLQRHPQDRTRYLLDKEWRSFEEQDVVIYVKLFGDFQLPVKRKILRSRHGPVVEGPHGSYALRYAGHGEIRQLEQYYRLNQAKNFNQFLAAMAMNALPSINYVYADREDNIAFIHNAQYPQRNVGWDWQKDLPGTHADLIWQRYLPFAQVPKLVNPESGLLYNANNTPFHATDGTDNLRSEDFPQWMGLASNETNRSLRLKALNDGVGLLTKQELLRQKFDVRYSPESEHVALWKKFTSLSAEQYPHLETALRLLAQWDFSAAQDDPHAALALLAARRVLRSETPEDQSAERLARELTAVVEFLNQHFSRLDVAWGQVNRLQRGALDLPLDGGPDTLRAIYAIDTDPEKLPYATHGDTWMAVVEWPENGAVSADLMHQFGSATIDSTSAHYADQAPLFAKHQWRRAILGWDAVSAQAERTYQLGGRP